MTIFLTVLITFTATCSLIALLGFIIRTQRALSRKVDDRFLGIEIDNIYTAINEANARTENRYNDCLDRMYDMQDKITKQEKGLQTPP